MELDVLTGQTVTSVDLEHGFVFLGSKGDTLQIEQPFDRVSAGGDRLHVGEEIWTPHEAILDVQSLTVERAEFTDDKRLVVTFDDRSTLEVAAHPRWESWHVNRQDGSTLDCVGGGTLFESPSDDELPSLGEALIEWARASIEQIETSEATLVGVDIRSLSRKSEDEVPFRRHLLRSFLEMLEAVDAFTTDHTAVLGFVIGKSDASALDMDGPSFDQFLDSDAPGAAAPRFWVAAPGYWANFERREEYRRPVGGVLDGGVPVRVWYQASRPIADSGAPRDWLQWFMVRSYLPSGNELVWELDRFTPAPGSAE